MLDSAVHANHTHHFQAGVHHGVDANRSHHPQPSLAICFTGMYRTMDSPEVLRSTTALLHAFPRADVFTAIGLEENMETYKGGGVGTKSVADVERVLSMARARNQNVTHYHLSHEEEAWARCNSTMLSQYHKLALCHQRVIERQIATGHIYDWVLRARADVYWRKEVDHLLQLPEPRTDPVVVQGMLSRASDWFIFVPGRHVKLFLDLPQVPCDWGVTTRNWDVWDKYLATRKVTKLPLREMHGGWPWRIEIKRTPRSLEKDPLCKQRSSGCFDLTFDQLKAIKEGIKLRSPPPPSPLPASMAHTAKSQARPNSSHHAAREGRGVSNHQRFITC